MSLLTPLTCGFIVPERLWPIPFRRRLQGGPYTIPVAYAPIPAWLDEMPLDSPDRVRHAWHLIGHPSVRGRLRQVDGLGHDEAVAVIAVMRRRIRRAAWEHNVRLHYTGRT